MNFNYPQQQSRVDSEVHGTRVAPLWGQNLSQNPEELPQCFSLHLAGVSQEWHTQVASREMDMEQAFLSQPSQLLLSAGSLEETTHSAEGQLFTGWC